MVMGKVRIRSEDAAEDRGLGKWLPCTCNKHRAQTWLVCVSQTWVPATVSTSPTATDDLLQGTRSEARAGPTNDLRPEALELARNLRHGPLSRTKFTENHSTARGT